MRFIQCARNKTEQNASISQHKGRIYYRILRDLHIGEEILVWYDESYEQYMGVPILHYYKGIMFEIYKCAVLCNIRNDVTSVVQKNLHRISKNCSKKSLEKYL